MRRGRAITCTGIRINAPAAIHSEKLARLRAELRERGNDAIGLAKQTSNLFRNRAARSRPRIDLAGFNQVIAVDRAAGIVECEAMTTYADLAEASASLAQAETAYRAALAAVAHTLKLSLLDFMK